MPEPFLVSGLLWALIQVSAGQAPQGAASVGRTEVPDPMQIEVSLGADADSQGKARPSFEQQPLAKVRAYPETDRFVCDQARVRMLTIKKVEETPEEVAVEVGLTMVSEWPMQDVDLTVALVSKDGKVIGQQFWDNLTLGAWSHSYKPPRAKFMIPAARWHELFADGASPLLRVVVDIQE
jgi:hypothetical protein